ncbi:hypothetical protein ACRALDRAFT_209691 [Sodiomyces alcalophilus JCM 7366]|uniref:uncharacterized protein n=1 Tax=Sodiomyces alcalophilus JCM 7366 TaxID=591952 RepID=UPI0039B64531
MLSMNPSPLAKPKRRPHCRLYIISRYPESLAVMSTNEERLQEIKAAIRFEEQSMEVSEKELTETLKLVENMTDAEVQQITRSASNSRQKRGKNDSPEPENKDMIDLYMETIEKHRGDIRGNKLRIAKLKEIAEKLEGGVEDGR